MNCKPTLLWVDMTVSVREAELPAAFTEACEIKLCPQLALVDEIICAGGFNGVCFDVDYPDQSSLSLIRDIKTRYPSLPILFLTLQHSEPLAVWAFRTGVIDYLVKPVSRTELHRCLGILNKVTTFRATQSSRQLLDQIAPIPAEVPVVVRKDGGGLLPALYYVKRNFRFKIRNETVAALCGTSPFRFCRQFREAYGITFQDYVIRYRILEACRILRNPNTGVTDVAYAVGFNDASYFSRTFKKHIGTQPSSYSVEFRNKFAFSETSDEIRTILQLPDESAANQ